MPIDASAIDSLLRDLENGQTQLESKVNGRIIRAMRELLGMARGVVHEKSGDLRDSLFIIAPSAIAPEVTESQIASRLFYAELEADRGGEHDYPARTIEEGAAIIDELAEDLARIYMAAFGVGSS